MLAFNYFPVSIKWSNGEYDTWFRKVHNGRQVLNKSKSTGHKRTKCGIWLLCDTRPNRPASEIGWGPSERCECVPSCIALCLCYLESACSLRSPLLHFLGLHSTHYSGPHWDMSHLGSFAQEKSSDGALDAQEFVRFTLRANWILEKTIWTIGGECSRKRHDVIFAKHVLIHYSMTGVVQFLNKWLTWTGSI